MQIVIPMSGTGQRFQRAGYKVPKPLIEVEGKPIIAHVLDMFPGETDVVFICNREHLADASLRLGSTLRGLCPAGRIVAIDPHKLGPVHAVLEAADAIKPDSPVIINYCDFTCYWDWRDFRAFVEETGCDGCIPSYRGFHPHMLHSTSFAYTRNEALWATAIQEKQPYTANPSQEFASSGTYYFRTGAKALEYCRRTVASNLTLSGEYYVSLVYRPMIEAGEAVAIYELQHFMQWGTPEDLGDYNNYSNLFRALADSTSSTSGSKRPGALVMPMAGAGQRFADKGYALPKPLIPVSGTPMVVQAAADLPAYEKQSFVLRRDLPELEAIEAGLTSAFPHGTRVVLEALTDGQARTALAGLDAVDEDAPITIGACDTGVLYDAAALDGLLNDPQTDVVVWGMRGHPGAAKRPAMYGWIDAAEDGLVRSVSVKIPLANPAADPAIVGVFSFRRASDFRRSAERMFARQARVNGEFYVDMAINDAIALGLRCRLFVIDHYVGWGTPEDLESFEYWQSCFHKWPAHPYRLERDRRVHPAAVAVLDARYNDWRTPRPGPRP